MQRRQIKQSVILDLNAEKVRIEIEINKLKSLKETTEREANGVALKVKSLQEKANELDTYIKDMSNLVIKYGEEARNTIIGWQNIVLYAREIAKMAFKSVDSAEDELDAVQTKLNALKADCETVHNNNVKELEEMNIKKRDLDIYKARMEKRYPNEKFII